jgi:hypothetical protein
MSKSSEIVRITAGPYTFRAHWEAAAPETIKWFRSQLPYIQKIIHVRWSGEACWVPLGYADLQLPHENSTSHPASGAIIVYPGGISETEILFAYGACSFSSGLFAASINTHKLTSRNAGIVGQVAGNHFLTVFEGKENLHNLGKLVLWNGAQDVRFELERPSKL